MASEHERFWEHTRYAVVGHSARKRFPILTYRGLRRLGKTVFAVDPSRRWVDGDWACPDLAALPEKVDAAVIELPRQETAEWVRRAADAGIGRVWLHMLSETPEALAVARERGLSVLSGRCAVMYLDPYSYHGVHRWLARATSRY